MSAISPLQLIGSQRAGIDVLSLHNASHKKFVVFASLLAFNMARTPPCPELLGHNSFAVITILIPYWKIQAAIYDNAWCFQSRVALFSTWHTPSVPQYQSTVSSKAALKKPHWVILRTGSRSLSRLGLKASMSADWPSSSYSYCVTIAEMYYYTN